MPIEIYPSSYKCDCGYQCDFSENTINELKIKSMKRKQYLIADDNKHEVIFYQGVMIAVHCSGKEWMKKMKIETANNNINTDAE